MTAPRAVIFGSSGPRLTAEERAFFADADPWGFILFARNVETPDQVRALTSEMREAVGRAAPVLVDQEGGRVQRFRAPHWRGFPPALAEGFGRSISDAAEALVLRYRLIAMELRDLGIDCNCAPSGDLVWPQTHEFLKNRCYGSDPGVVGQLGQAAARGMLDGGVLPIAKHIPGHGRAHLDTHFDLPRVDLDEDALMQTDFAPFRAMADLPMGMTAHVVFSALTDRAATVSEAMITLIRDRIGFAGLLMTDDLSMQALRGTPAERTQSALDAGCDVALFCNAPLADRIAVAEAAGPMTDAAQTRAEAALAALQTPQGLDVEAAEDELATVTGGGAYV